MAALAVVAVAEAGTDDAGARFIINQHTKIQICMRKQAWLAVVFLTTLISFSSSAQTYTETALLFSQTAPVGSARYSAIGGAGVSLGADLAAAFRNPAGLGMYNRGDLAVSVGYADNQLNSSYFGSSMNGGRTSLSIPFFGISFHTPRDGEKLISTSLAVTYNKMADFNRTLSYQGVNNKNSLIDYFINDGYDADGYALDPGDLYSPTNLAFETYLIDTLTTNNFLDYGSVLSFNSARQNETVKTTGATTQWNISYGVNIADRIFLGAGIGLRDVTFTNRKTYTESGFTYSTSNYDPLDRFTLEETLKVSGTGYNLLLGAIFRPIDGLQAGIAYESPTWLVITDVYNASLDAVWKNFDYYGDGNPLRDVSARLDQGLVTDYRLRTPSKITAGFSYIVGKKGFLTAEAESVNYGGGSYTSRTDGVSFDADNAQIRELYIKALTFRAGGEWRMGNMRYRGGVSLRPDPYTVPQNGISTASTIITAGAGYRNSKYYIDCALGYGQSNQSYRPYRVPSADSPLVKSVENRLTFQATVGMVFSN